jgi:uncharacterized membrane protein YsdA (DUF1294 family)
MENNTYFLYLAAINVITFVAFFWDKQAAKGNRWRTSNRILLLLLMLGGVVGGWLGIYKVRHKSDAHKNFIFHLTFALAAVMHFTLMLWVLAEYPVLP